MPAHRLAPPRVFLALVSLALSLALSLATAPALLADEIITIVYDVRDLLHPRPDFPAPRLGLQGLEEQEQGIAIEAEDENDGAWTMEELVELIREVLGEELETAGVKVNALGSNLVISLPARSQERVSTALGGLRDGGRADFTIEARWIELPEEAIAALGLPAGRPERAVRLGAEAGARLLAAIAAREDAKVITAPRMTVLANQRSHVVVMDQEAYVDRFEVDAQGIADPVIATLSTGLTLETKVRPRRGREGVIIDWEAQVARALPPEPAEPAPDAPAPDAAAEPELGLPEVTTVVREGRTALAPGELVVVRGLPSPESELPTLLVIGWGRAPKE